jgi:TolA-binding protein
MNGMRLVGALVALMMLSSVVDAQNSRAPSSPDTSSTTAGQSQAHRLARLERYVADLENRVGVLEDQVATEQITNQNLEIQIVTLRRDLRR